MILRFFCLVLVLLAAAVGVFALAGVLQSFGYSTPQWPGVLGQVNTVYGQLAQFAFTQLRAFASEQFLFTLPAWFAHALIGYFSATLALFVGSVGVARRDTLWSGFGSGIVALSWPISLVGLVLQSLRKRAVTKLVRDHSLAALSYGLLVAAGYVGAVQLTETNGQNSVSDFTVPSQHPAVLKNDQHAINQLSGDSGSFQAEPQNSIRLEPIDDRLIISPETMRGYLDEEGTNKRSNILSEVVARWEALNAEVVRLYGEGNLLEATKKAEEALVLAENEFGSAHPNTLVSVINLGFLYQALGLYDKAEPLYVRALEASERVLGREHPDTLTSLNNLAMLYYALGHYDKAEPLMVRALETRERVLGPEHPDTLTSANNLGLLFHAQGRFDEAQPLYERTLETRERVLGPEHPDTLISYNNLSGLYWSQGHYDKVEPLLVRVLSVRERVLGPEHPSTLTSLNNLASLYRAQGFYDKAEPLFVRALEARERVSGPEHPDTLVSVNNLGLLYQVQGFYDKAEPLFVRALEARQRVLGQEHPDTLSSVDNLADLYSAQALYDKAEPLYIRALEARERVLGPEHPSTLISIGGLGFLHMYRGHYDKAEPLLVRALEISERVLGHEHPSTLVYSNNLAGLYQAQGRYKKAEPLFVRVLATRERVLGSEHPDTLSSLNNLAALYEAQGLYDKAEPLYVRVFEASERVLGPEHPYTLTFVNNLAALYEAQGLYDKSEPLHLRALEARVQVLGPEHPDTLSSINNLAFLYRAQGYHNKAEPLFVRALEASERVLGGKHPSTLKFAINLALLYEAQGLYDEAEPLLSQVLDKLGAASFVLGSDGAVSELVRLNMLRDTVFPNVVSSLFVDGYSDDQRSRLLNASFVALQRINGTSVGADIVQASARASEGDAGLAALVERLEEVSIDVRRVEAELEFAANLTASAERDERLARLKGELETATERARGIAGEIRESYPDYAELALPQGLSAEDVGDLLDEGEAVVSYAFVGKDEEEFLLAIVALPDGSLELFKLDVTKAAIEERVSKLREGVALPSGESFDASTLALDLAFDMSAAEELYGDLFRPLEEYLGASDHVIVVADGPLESLPFNLLVRSQASTNGSDEDLFSVYRDAEWLIDRYAISSVPSISSLKALRDRGAPEGDLPFLGIGHPSLEGKTTQTAANDNNDDADVIKRITLGLGDTVDVKRVKELSPVPQTAGMLQALAAALNADGSHVLLRDDAEERDLRALEKDKTLKEYQTIAFGTHALIARELRQVGLNEPALVLSPPANDTEEYDPNNDGLLRASEVVGLTLDADWVLLTACNTAAPDGTLGAEPLTGLAKSFFYAGARSLLVSHWPAEATATARLAPAMIQETNQGSSKAQALRQAMRQMKQDTTCGPNAPTTQTCPENAHPALWATFTISGEAG